MPSVSNPLQQAVFRGCVECIRMLVETPPFYSVDSSCGPDGLRPIHIAAREGHIQTLRYLAAAGACLQRSDVNGATALHHAAISGQLRAVRWLLRHGAKILLDKRGRSPIQVAADHDHMEIVSVLAKHATCGTTQATTTTSASNNNSNSLAIREQGNLSSLPATITTTGSSNNNSSSSNLNGTNNHNIISGSATISANHNISNNSDSLSTISPTNTTRNINSSINHNNNNNNDSGATKNYGNNHNHSLSLVDGSSEEPLNENNKASITGGGDCASSSGNSSLTTTSANTPSLSPSSSSSSAVSCGCSASSENSDELPLKSSAEVSDSFILEEFNSPKSSGRPSVVSPSPFYLHPPKSGSGSISNSSSSGNVSGSSGSSSGGSSPQQEKTSKKATHKRQVSTCSPASSPFFLHPPENLVSETQKAVVAKMAPAPVNPSHGHHHVTELINESHTPKMKGGEISSTASSASSSGSPPPTPPAQKSSLSPVVPDFPTNADTNKNSMNNGVNNKTSEITPSSPPPANNNDTQINNSINNSKNVPPPPPPPPMPNFSELNQNGNNLHIHNNYNNNMHHYNTTNGNLHGVISELERMNGRTHSPKTPDTDLLDDNLEGEHDYEVIDELTNHVSSNNHTNHYEFNKKLARSVSAPPPPLDHNMNGHGLLDEKPGTPTVPSHMLKNLGMGGKPGVPFIPPHFPTPAHDALIKPSEYLRSIQQTQGGKPKYATSNGTNPNNNGNPNGGIVRPLSRVEEAIKALGATDNHLGLMSPVPEETNVEDEFEEINPERINGTVINGDAPVNKPNGNENANRENNNNNSNTNNNNNNTMHYSNGQCKGGGVIKAEELLKVNLRKTPMSRTKSAPPLGRVVPDGEHHGVKNGLANISENGSSQHSNQQNGHEILKKSTSVLNNNMQNGEMGTMSRQAVIAELAESSQVGGVREWKEELRRRQVEQEKNAQKEIAQYYQPVNFVSEVPSTDVSGTPIPAWKRQMMAKKAAERARKEAEEQRKMELEAKRMASIPMWRRQLLQRRESDGKYAQ